MNDVLFSLVFIVNNVQKLYFMNYALQCQSNLDPHNVNMLLVTCSYHIFM